MISIIVMCFDMPREAPRTLYTLSRAYQRDVDDLDYEVIVVDNGSRRPLSAADVEAFGPEFRYVYWETDSPSPVGAIRAAATEARGDVLAIMNDGARMVTPGVLTLTARAFRAWDAPVVAVAGYHLGPGCQDATMQRGYDQRAEDALLASVDWRADGYRLFDLAALAGSSADGVFLPLAESNFLALHRTIYDAMGGAHPGFVSPGGGLIALDLFKCAWEHAGVEPVLLLGEGTFHQFHGGVATNADASLREARLARMFAEYAAVRGAEYTPPSVAPTHLGHVTPPAARFLRTSAARLAESAPWRPVSAMRVGAHPVATWLERAQDLLDRANAWRRSRR